MGTGGIDKSLPKLPPGIESPEDAIDISAELGLDPLDMPEAFELHVLKRGENTDRDSRKSSTQDLRKDNDSRLLPGERMLRALWGNNTDPEWDPKEEQPEDVAPYVLVSPESVSVVHGPTSGAHFYRTGMIFHGDVGFSCRPERIRVGTDLIFNPLLNGCIPSTVLSPIPVFLKSLKTGPLGGTDRAARASAIAYEAASKNMDLFSPDAPTPEVEPFIPGVDDLLRSIKNGY